MFQLVKNRFIKYAFDVLRQFKIKNKKKFQSNFNSLQYYFIVVVTCNNAFILSNISTIMFI